MPPFVRRSGTWVISSQPLQLPLVLRPSSARVLSINTGPPCAYVYYVYTFCFCLKISASLCRANDVSYIRANCDLRSKKHLRFLSFRQRGTTFFGFLLSRRRLLLCLQAVLLSLVTACQVRYHQHRAIGGDTGLSPSRVILVEDVVQCQRDRPRCNLWSPKP